MIYYYDTCNKLLANLSDLLYNITLCVNPLSIKATVKLHRSSYNQVLNRNPDSQL